MRRATFFVKKMQDCINWEITKYYNAWLSKAQRLTKSKDKGSDLLHIVIERLLNRPEEDIVDRACNGKLNSYVTRAIWVSWHSSSSDYHRVYRGKQVLNTPVEQLANMTDDVFMGAAIDGEYVFNYLSRVNEHDAVLLRLYAQPDFDYSTISRETGIPVRYLYKAVEKALNRIRKHVKFKRNPSG